MTKVTYTNAVNGLSCMFSADNPMMFLESIDGCSCGSEAITYRPLSLNRQRFVSYTLTARTVQLTVNFGGKADGKYSRIEAMKRWEEIQRVFVPGNTGTLTWTNGTESRFIKCRTSETPKPSELLPYLFRASFSLTADDPLWYDSVENVVELTNGVMGRGYGAGNMELAGQPEFAGQFGFQDNTNFLLILDKYVYLCYNIKG